MITKVLQKMARGTAVMKDCYHCDTPFLDLEMPI